MTLTILARQAFLALAALTFVAVPVWAQDKFQPDCPPPFENPRHKQQVDRKCANEGKFDDGSDTAEHRAQNRAKNSLCAKGASGAVASDPIPVTVSTFDLLQRNIPADVDFGSSANLPKDRDQLKNIPINSGGASIGEGSYVVFVGFMMEAHAAGKESVSCQKGTVVFSDIHIALAANKTTNTCKSITAEMIPHFRPQSWPRIYFKETYKEIKAHPLRIKGQLFFDGSHRPCGDPHMGGKDPSRRSSWEIHPVYSVDVCRNKSLAACRVDDESVWTPFAEWIASQ